MCVASPRATPHKSGTDKCVKRLGIDAEYLDRGAFDQLLCFEMRRGSAMTFVFPNCAVLRVPTAQGESCETQEDKTDLRRPFHDASMHITKTFVINLPEKGLMMHKLLLLMIMVVSVGLTACATSNEGTVGEVKTAKKVAACRAFMPTGSHRAVRSCSGSRDQVDSQVQVMSRDQWERGVYHGARPAAVTD